MDSTPIQNPAPLFRAMVDEVWDYLVEILIPVRISENLPLKYYPPVSFSECQRQQDRLNRFLTELQRISFHNLTLSDQLLYKNLKWNLEMFIERHEFYWMEFPVLPYTSPLNAVHQAISQIIIHNSKDFQHYLDYLTEFPPFIQKIHHKLQLQMDRGILIPVPEIPLVTNFLSNFLQPVEKTIYWLDASHFLKKEDLSRYHSYFESLRILIRDRILPTLQDLVRFFNEDYISQAPTTIGLHNFSQGLAYYQFLIRFQLSLDLTPKEIFEIGQQQVAELNQQLQAIQHEDAFKGTLSDYHAHLMEQPQFYGQTHTEVIDCYTKYLKDMQNKLPMLFEKIPEAPCKVARLDPRLEGTWTFGYYKAPSPDDPIGIYYFNGKQLNEQPLLKAAALIYHELVPGHHFQISLLQERPLHHKIQRFLNNNGYIEGWADYAFMLGDDVGLYSDRYDRYGKLLLEKEAAIRLVVDPGLNAFRWTESQAQKYMFEEFFGPMQQIETEVLRYAIDMPAQALAYRLGSLQFCKLRKKYEQILGEKFELGVFHDAILRNGPVPFPVLEWYLDQVLLPQA